MQATPPTLPNDPRTMPMPEPFSTAWNDWLPTTYRMNLAQMIQAAGCDIRGCRVENAWDEEHRCRAFYHNGTPITWDDYQALQPKAETDHEAFFRVVWQLHQREANPDAPPVLPAEPPKMDPVEKKAVDRAYAERDMCISLVARLAMTAGFRAYIAPDVTSEEGWRNVVFIELPSGQVSWHIHDRELQWFRGVPREEKNSWDGHDTTEKYARVLAAWPWESR